MSKCMHMTGDRSIIMATTVDQMLLIWVILARCQYFVHSGVPTHNVAQCKHSCLSGNGRGTL